MSRKATLTEIAALSTRRDELTRHIALANRLEKPAIAALFTRELARIDVKLAAFDAQTKPKAPKTKTPIAWVKDIRRFFAIANEKGLDTSDAADARMRRAFEDLVCRPIESRSELRGSDWRAAADAMKAGYFVW